MYLRHMVAEVCSHLLLVQPFEGQTMVRTTVIVVLEHAPLNWSFACRMSWTLTPQITTLIHGLVSYPSTLLQLADSANVLLPDFFDAQLAEGRKEFPQVLITDHFQSAYLVPMSTRINRIEPCLGADPS
jgi:hypothetical protein